jgi:myo-inositol-1(or 4)-monophosphatase
MIRAAEKAARSLLRDFNEVEKLQVSVKGPGDFVSAADRRAEEIIYEELSKAKTDWGFLMEESGSKVGKIDKRFIVDPLDGTTNFLHGIPHWCISIAAEENGKITAGVIFDPVKDELFFAEPGKGAWMRGNQRLRVSGRKDLMMCVAATEDKMSSPHIPAVEEKLANLKKVGSTALNLAYVAAGRFDAYFGGSPKQGPKAWDMAAGHIIVKEAGGYVSEINGQSNHIYNQNILAGNEHVYQALKEILNKA